MARGFRRRRFSGQAIVIALACAAAGLVVLSQRAGRADAAGGRAVRVDTRDAYDGQSWFVLQRSYPTGRAPSGALIDRLWSGRQPDPSNRRSLALPGDRWISMGPQPIAVVQGGTSLSFSGRVTAVAPHPTDARILYVGTDGGGIWRSLDAGLTWASLTDTLPVPAIQSLVVDPVDPRLLYATTIQRTYPVRLLRSTDGGSSWTASSITLDSGQTLSSALCSVNVYKACIPPSAGTIFLDPTRAGSPNTSTLFFVGSSHLLRSDDSGRTFHVVFSLGVDLDFAGPDAAALNPEVEFVRDAAIDPARPERLFVAIAQPHCVSSDCRTAQSTIALYRSFDAGAHWSRQTIATLAPFANETTRYADPGAVYVPRVRLAVSPSNPDVMALACRDTQIGRPRVFRSVDAGNTFTEPSPLASVLLLTWPLGLAFSPTDANTMYLSSNGVYVTNDAGATWRSLGSRHSDNIAIAFDAHGVPLVGGDGGLFQVAGGNSLVPLHAGLSITEFYSVAAHPTNALLLAGGTQDNGTAIFQGNVGWSLITGGDGGDTVFDPSPASNVFYAEVEWFFDSGGNVFTFFRCQPGGCISRTGGMDLTLAGPFIPRMAMDPTNPSTLWLTVEKLLRTDDRGDSWTAASPSVGTAKRCWTDPVSGAVCADGRYFVAAAVAPSSSPTVYAGALNGDVWLTTDRGANWHSIAGPTAGPLPVRAVNDIVVDPLNAQSAFVAYSGFDSNGSGRGHVFRTVDAGATWQDVTGNLPDVPVNTLLIDPDSLSTGSSRVLYAGTDIGVFRVTLDGSANWAPFGTGMPPVVVNRLAYNASTHQLLAATYGRGIWAISSRFNR